MDKKNEKIIELTLEQMDMISGGAGTGNAAVVFCPICKRAFNSAYVLSLHLTQFHTAKGNSNTPEH